MSDQSAEDEPEMFGRFECPECLAERDFEKIPAGTKARGLIQIYDVTCIECGLVKKQVEEYTS